MKTESYPSILFLIISLFLNLLILGCAVITPAQNFREGLNSYIGKDISADPYYGKAYSGNLQKVIELESGNEFRIYLLKKPQGECLYGLEVEGNSSIVKGWRILEDKNGCITIP